MIDRNNSIDKNGYFKKTIFFSLLLLVTNFICNRFVMDTVNMVTIKNLAGLLLFFICFPVFFSRKKPLFSNEFILILVSLVVSAFSSEALYGQPLTESFKPSMQIVLALSLYLFAHKYNLSENSVIKMLVIFSFAYTSIELFQQFTYPDYWFCGRIEKFKREQLEMRMGLYRFVLDGLFFCVLSLILTFNQLIHKRKNTTLEIFTFVIIFGGVLMNLERKIIIPVIAILFLAVLISRRASASRYIILSIFVIILIILSQYVEFLNKQSMDELNDPDFIRFLAMNYYAYEMNSSPLYYYFGAGIPNNSSLSALIDYMETVYHYFQEDVGLVGYLSKFGFLGLLPHALIVYKIIKNRKFVDLALLLYLVMLLFISYFKFWGNYLPNYAAFTLYLYLIEKSIVRNKAKLSTKKFESLINYK